MIPIVVIVSGSPVVAVFVSRTKFWFGVTITLAFSAYFAHLNNSSTDDFLRVQIVGTTTTTVFQQLGSAAQVNGAFARQSANISSFAGQTIRILITTADAAGGSLVEAGVDDVTITHQ